MLELTNLTLEFGDRTLFSNVNLQLHPNHCYGLVGANGTGKSTLLKILTGEAQDYSGQASWPKYAKVGYLKQDHFAYENTRIVDTVIQGLPELWQARKIQDELTQKNEMSLDEAQRYAEAEEIILQFDGYSAESNAARLLNGLGIPDALQEEPLKTLSGGYKLRVLMAQLLFSQPDILLLDEPTNHLDIFTIKWLEGYLREFKGLLLVVSHDREFLNSICSHVLDIDYQQIKLYTGNYDAFLAAKELEREQIERANANQEKKKADMEAFVRRFKAKASFASMAQSRVKKMEKMEDFDIKVSSRSYPQFIFEPSLNSGRIPVEITDLSKSFDDKKVLNDLNIQIERGDRVAIIGPNGVGKSTLLKIIMQEMTPDSGQSKWGHETHPGYFPQDYHDLMKGDQTCFDWLYSFDATASPGLIRNLLGRLLFSGDDVKNKLSSLSGGEATRLIFAKLMLEANNILILDEPTNHLDLEAIDMLTSALSKYKGTLLLVSHNRFFVSNIATRIIELKPDGFLDFKGTYAEYLEKQGVDHLSRDVSLKDRAVLGDQLKSKAKKDKPALSGKAAYKAYKARKRKMDKLKKTIAQLQESSEELKSQLEASPTPAIEAQLDEKLRQWNAAKVDLEELEAEDD